MGKVLYQELLDVMQENGVNTRNGRYTHSTSAREKMGWETPRTYRALRMAENEQRVIPLGYCPLESGGFATLWTINDLNLKPIDAVGHFFKIDTNSFRNPDKMIGPRTSYIYLRCSLDGSNQGRINGWMDKRKGVEAANEELKELSQRIGKMNISELARRKAVEVFDNPTISTQDIDEAIGVLSTRQYQASRLDERSQERVLDLNVKNVSDTWRLW